jgi:hypothetical protein
MSTALAVIMFIGAGVLIALVWKKVASDEVGDVIKDNTGFGVQGRVADWLGDSAPLRAPRPPQQRVRKGRPDPESPAGRALAALIREEMVLHRMDPEAAHSRLAMRAPGPVSRAFLDGRMRRAVFLHAITRFTGPAFLFWPWFTFIALVRYGRRRLYLDTVTAVVREMRS